MALTTLRGTLNVTDDIEINGVPITNPSNIVNADISASAAIARSKLAATGVTAETTPDAADSGDWTADGAAVVALVNALKAKLNALIAAA